MAKHDFEKQECYQIKKMVLWVGIILLLFICLVTSIKITSEDNKTEKGYLESKLKNTTECYLCGDSEYSMMEYYRKFATIGVIGLNEWYVLDLRLKEYDQQGVENGDTGSVSILGNTKGVTYQIETLPSRGRSRASVSSDDKFNAEVIQKNLCQECLDKVVKASMIYQCNEESEKYNLFVLVDFKTLKVYSLQGCYTRIVIRDYSVKISSSEDDNKIHIEVCYLSER